jgi:hypothetical protein
MGGGIMSEELSEYFSDIRESKRRRQEENYNRIQPEKQLKEAGYSLERKGNNQFIKHKGHRIDFWPETGTFYNYATKERGDGVKNLIKLLNNLKDKE